MFTRITVIVAACWILLCILAINVLGTTTSRISPALGGAAGQRVQSEIPATPPADGEAQADKDKQATDAKAEGESTPPAPPATE